MSGKVTGLVWDLDLPQNEKYVLLAYADKADHEGDNAHPGVGLVAWMTGYSEDSVRRITRGLINTRGLLEVQERGGGGRANKFRVCLENFKSYERSPRKRRGRPSEQENPPQENPPQNNGGLNDPKTPITAIPPQRPYTTSGNYETLRVSSEPEDSHHITPEDMPLDKYITDKLYDRMKEEGIRWTRDEYSFHLGRVQNMLLNDGPSDVEIEMLPAALAGEYAFNPKADAVAALKGYRRQKMREAITSGRKEHGVTALKVEKGEYETPFSDQAIKNRDAIRKWPWYLAAFGDRLSNEEIQARLDEAKEQDKGHEETARALTADWLGKDEGEDE